MNEIAYCVAAVFPESNVTKYVKNGTTHELSTKLATAKLWTSHETASDRVVAQQRAYDYDIEQGRRMAADRVIWKVVGVKLCSE